MLPELKSRNFRLSDQTMNQLDELVIHYGQKESVGYFMRNVTRTDVIRSLIVKEWKRIEEEAKAVRDRAQVVIKESEKVLAKTKKAVRK